MLISRFARNDSDINNTYLGIFRRGEAAPKDAYFPLK
jgi:hypothetical protein